MLDYPQVAMDFMNRDHAEFIALRARLLGLLSIPAAENDLDSLFRELFEHTKHHFAEEERLMQETHFPPYRMHKMEHDRVLADMELHFNGWLEGRDKTALQNWIQNDVDSWFVNHVSTMDFVTAGFIATKQKAG